MDWRSVRKMEASSQGSSDGSLYVEAHADGWRVVVDDRPISFHASLTEACEHADGLRSHGHVSLDSRIAHCPFCGSGAVVARSDESVECSICQRAFVVMEQPLYSAMPGAEYQGMEIDGEPVVEDPTPTAFAPPPQPAQPEADPFADDENPITASSYVTDTGERLTRAAYIRHLAHKHRV